MPGTLSIRLSRPADALDRFEAAWHLATGRPAPAQVRLLSFANLPLLLKTLSPARWQLLERLHSEGPMSVRALAKRLARDYKNVHTDVGQLLQLGLIERTGASLVRVPWDAVRAELKL
jgi:predicted transcriptional regulator